MARKVNEIAKEIRADWTNVNYAAVPYLDAMDEIESVKSMFYCDSSASIVRYFLSNATTWRGAVARRVKKELNEMVEGIF